MSRTGRERAWWHTPVVAAITAAVTVAGVATAQQMINGRNLIDGSVTRAKLQQRAVGEVQIAAGAVTSTQLRNNAVRSANIAANAVQTRGIANRQVTSAKLALGAALPGLRVRATEVTVNPGGAALAQSCATNEVALSGGYGSVPPGTSNVLNDRPTPAADGALPTGWQVFVDNKTAQPTQIVVYAVCVRRG
jgi:hypothetical protein